MTNRRRRTDRRSRPERGGVMRRHDDWSSTPSWGQQRLQFLTRFFFLLLGVLYFTLGEPPRHSGLVNPFILFSGLAIYGTLVTIFFVHARRQLNSPMRWHAMLWIDLGGVTFAILSDPIVVSPAFVVYVVVILGNGLRYGMRYFAEGMVGSFILGVSVLLVRLADFYRILSMSTAYFVLFGAILVLYAYALMSGFDRARRQLEAERSLDVLTGLLNRRALYERVEPLFRRTPEGSDNLGVAVLFADLDRFKAVNDNLGHHVGDRVLGEIARLLAQEVRASDILARFGGDEFVFVLPDTDSTTAREVATRLQQAVAHWAQEQTINISLSVGIGHAPEHGQDLKGVLERVDQAMYQSKAQGRGGIVCVGENGNS
ncbi:MAG: GGDEF domain-containing protein [Pseudomonadota bacterium]|nr:MAG: GGDEF domain-containing protein [Pseudomonadota bacterium]